MKLEATSLNPIAWKLRKGLLGHCYHPSLCSYQELATAPTNGSAAVKTAEPAGSDAESESDDEDEETAAEVAPATSKNGAVTVAKAQEASENDSEEDGEEEEEDSDSDTPPVKAAVPAKKQPVSDKKAQ